MGSVIVALPKIQDAKYISNILRKHGIDANFVCTTGAAVLSNANNLSNGVVVCGCKLTDMHYTRLLQYMPKNFEMLLLASLESLQDCPPGVLTLSFPIRANDLISTVEMILATQARKIKKQKSAPKKRSWQEQNYINNAKWVLMERNNMTEQEAFRYIQKTSMDSGTNLIETAQMILMMIFDG